MDASEYQQLAARTLLCEPDVVYTTQELMVVWNTMGVVGEIGEIQLGGPRLKIGRIIWIMVFHDLSL